MSGDQVVGERDRRTASFYAPATTPPPPAAAPRLVFLDGIRALAAVAVVLHHGYQTVTADGSIRRHLSVLGYGNFAVAVFIVVSGFSLAIAAARRRRHQPFWTFIRRRAWRIVPPYLAALVLSIAMIAWVIGTPTGTPWDLVLPFSPAGAAVNALLLQDLLPARAPNHVFWSIAIEWHLYFLFPLLFALRRRLPAWGLLALGAVACAALWPTYGGDPYTGFPPQFLGLFVLGVVAGDLVTARGEQGAGVVARSRWLQPAWALAAGVFAAPVVVFLARVDESFFAAELLLGSVVALFIVALTIGRASHPARRFLEWRPLAWVGLFSYSLYLTHAPVLQVVWQYGTEPMHLGADGEFIATLVAATVGSLAVAFLFHLVFERPFMNHRSIRALASHVRLHVRTG